MKFRNMTAGGLDVPALGLYVGPGEMTPDLPDDQAAGLVGQVDVWRAVGQEARSVQQDAIQVEPVPDPPVTTVTETSTVGENV